MKLSDIKRIYMIGIKGTGMSALAIVFSDLGIDVSGSDTKDSFLLLDVKNYTSRKIEIHSGFAKGHIPQNTDLIVAQSSHNHNKNPEIIEAKKLGIRIVDYPHALGMIMSEYPTISIAGSHGKTTTTNLLAYMLKKNKVPISALSGPTSQQVIDLGVKGSPRYFVAETDEYENKLKYYSPVGVLLTNVELDHPDYFKTKAQYNKVFSDYVIRIPESGFLVFWADDKETRLVAEKASCKKLSFGFSKSADYRIEILPPTKGSLRFTIRHRRELVGTYRTNLLGKHNILNTAAAILTARELGLNNKEIQSAISSFKGSPRRLQKVSSMPLIYDDYGHHPTEIRVTIEALRQAYPKKEIWTVFQAHTYTRTKVFLKEFGKSFSASDHVIVLNIWGSSREKKGKIDTTDLVHELEKNGVSTFYKPTRAVAAEFIKTHVSKKALILTIGASDIWKIHKLIS